MIIKEEKLAQVEPEPHVETPPPYSAAPEVRTAVASAPRDALADVQNAPAPVPQAPSQTASSSTRSTSAAIPTSISAPPPQDVRRKAYTHIHRVNSALVGRFVVDPYLPFPPGIESTEEDGIDLRLGGMEDGGADGYGYGWERGRSRNLRLVCENGSVNAEVWVVGGEGESNADGEDEIGDAAEKRKKAVMDVRAKNGFVVIKINTSVESPPFALRVGTRNGGIRVGVPRSFVGPLTTRSRNGWVRFTPALASATTHFSEVQGTRKSFVGDFADSGYGESEWHGSSIDLSCQNGRIKLFYLDEPTPESKSTSGWIGRLFGIH
ncbi:hypothetical protein EW145_g5707 [Phellinidium pouzarii]|uniref:DUF7330 domain-containing protein n=1 Tax=Phellinidium pouzarii TaxID=167371 RepID=A0A4S4KZ81_9AGAM|nr:hypothetical protein EW145_g5707 [Phellinidium pouzarii]